MNDTIKTSWVVIPEASAYVAVCLEYGFATSAKSLTDLPSEVARFLCVQQLAAKQEGAEAFDAAHRAPEKYWEQFENGAQLIMHIPDFNSRSFEGVFKMANHPNLTAGAC